MAWEVAAVAEVRQVVVILFSEPSIVTAADTVERTAVKILELREDLVEVLHAVQAVVRPSKLPPGLEISEEILQEV